MVQVFVGDVYESLADYAISVDPSATLFENLSNLTSDCKTYYTSLADCGFENFYHILDISDIIYYVEPDHWSDDQNVNERSMKFWTEKFLDLFSQCTTKQIHGYTRKLHDTSPIHHNFLELSDHRKTDSKQLWIAGCSNSHGIGVKKEERYGQLIANALDLPVSWLTKGGSSIQWARDQILRSDIRFDDILCWGITTTIRFPYYHKNKVQHVHIGFYEDNKWLNDIISIKKLEDQDQLYQSVTAIYQVKNFCEKVGAKLYMLDTLTADQNPIRNYLTDNIRNFEVCLSANDCFLDFGSDNAHPGPFQHIAYANYFLRMINDEC